MPRRLSPAFLLPVVVIGLGGCFLFRHPSSSSGSGSGPTDSPPPIPLSCLQGWWLGGSSGCDCADTRLPECAGSDCTVLDVEGYDADGVTWWSFLASASASTGTMTTWGLGERGTYIYADDVVDITDGDGRAISENVQSCTSSTMSRDYLQQTKATPGAAASFSAAVTQFGAQTNYSWSKAPYSP